MTEMGVVRTVKFKIPILVQVDLQTVEMFALLINLLLYR
jgi:hypothetical protein